MNCDTGELIRATEELDLANFKRVPEELEEEANRQLDDKDRVFVDMKQRTPLTKWARKNKTGRNQPCPCGSGIKYKKCCYGKVIEIEEL